MRDPLTLVAVGDLQLGDSPTSVGYGFYSRYAGASLESLLGGVRPALSNADVVFGNLETTLVPPTRGERRRTALQLRGEAAFATGMRHAGFDVVNVANNHAVQHGDDSFHATVAALRAAGIACCGVRGSSPWSSEPALLHRSNGVVGILGYCLRPRQYGAAVPPYAEGSRDEICRDVVRLRATGAVVIVSLHWGEEFVSTPSEEEVELGRAIIDSGAVLVLGHHPHVIRPVERYKSGVIAYSLGNFMGDMVWYAPFRRGLVLRCTLNEAGVVDSSLLTTTLQDDYRPVLSGEPPGTSIAPAQMQGLSATAYLRAIAETQRQQRVACYFGALRNLPRIPLTIIVQLTIDTVRNKAIAMLERVRPSGPRPVTTDRGNVRPPSDGRAR
jgi:poly-gamma-glutamate synthesis protein (capsule biosynthesis protein)